MNGGCVVWLTGLPSSGKSTLGKRLREELDRDERSSVLLDGDEVREALSPRPGYEEAGRADFYATLANLAGLIARQGLIVIVAATANRRAFRDAARAVAPRFVEVYVATPIEECRRRDTKGLYAAARNGTTSSVPGAGVDYEIPLAPDVIAAGGKDEAAIAAIVDAIQHAPHR